VITGFGEKEQTLILEQGPFPLIILQQSFKDLHIAIVYSSFQVVIALFSTFSREALTTATDIKQA